MATQTLPDRRDCARHVSRSTAPTTSSSTSATPSRRPLLSVRLRLSARCVSRARDRRARSRELPAASGQDPPRADVAARARGDDRRPRAASTAMACTTSRSGSTTRATRTPRPSSAAPSRRRSRGLARRRRRGRHRRDQIYGDTIHSLVERRNYRGLFLPGFQPREPRYQAEASRAQVRRPLRRQRRARAR